MESGETADIEHSQEIAEKISIREARIREIIEKHTPRERAIVFQLIEYCKLFDSEESTLKTLDSFMETIKIGIEIMHLDPIYVKQEARKQRLKDVSLKI